MVIILWRRGRDECRELGATLGASRRRPSGDRYTKPILKSLLTHMGAVLDQVIELRFHGFQILRRDGALETCEPIT